MSFDVDCHEKYAVVGQRYPMDVFLILEWQSLRGVMHQVDDCDSIAHYAQHTVAVRREQQIPVAVNLTTDLVEAIRKSHICCEKTTQRFIVVKCKLLNQSM